MEAGLLRAARAAGVPVPEVVAAGAPGRARSRLVGGRTPRGGDHPPTDPARRGARHGPHRSDRADGRRPWPPSTPSIPASVPGLPGADPLRPSRSVSSTRCTSSARSSSSGPGGWLSADPPVGSRPSSTVTSGWGTSWSTTMACAACSTGSWPTAATRSRTSAGCVRGPGGSADRAGSADSASSTRFLAAYAAAGGRAVHVDEVRWWEVYASVKWAVICLLQAGDPPERVRPARWNWPPSAGGSASASGTSWACSGWTLPRRRGGRRTGRRSGAGEPPVRHARRRPNCWRR